MLGDAGAIVVGTLWGGASRHHAALEAALTAAAEGLWPKLVLAGVEIRKVGKTGGTNIVRLDASDASTVKVDPAASLTINVDDSILVKDFSELVSWEVRVGLRGVTLNCITCPHIHDMNYMHRIHHINYIHYMCQFNTFSTHDTYITGITCIACIIYILEHCKTLHT